MADIQVLIVDDHPIVRAGLRSLLERAPGIQVVGEAGSGEEAIQKVQELAPDVLLLDMEIPGKGGIEVAQILQRQKTTVNILAVSAHNDRQYIESLLESGASGYLVKDELPEALVEAVRGVARGERGWISRQITNKMIDWMHSGSTQGVNLTNRETQVLKHVVAGRTNQEIGQKLGISDKTVEKHLEAIFKKLGVASRTEAAVWATREEMNSEASPAVE